MVCRVCLPEALRGAAPASPTNPSRGFTRVAGGGVPERFQGAAPQWCVCMVVCYVCRAVCGGVLRVGVRCLRGGAAGGSAAEDRCKN